MEELVKEVSPFRRFSRDEWSALRADTPMTLTQKDLDELRGLNDRIDLAEVETIYLPLSRLLNLYVAATQGLFRATNNFLHLSERKVPYVIGMAGSVAVGKSTTARILQRLLARWPKHPKVDLVTTDGFLLPNAILEREGLMTRKGFPESYDLPAILRFLSDIKAGKRNVTAPLYSHLTYDVLKDERAVIDQPDILIVEGVNVLQTGRPPRDGRGIPNTSDFFDFSIYIDADLGRSAQMVHRALPDAAGQRLPQSQILFPPLCDALRQGIARHGDAHLGHDQPREPARKHPAHAAARRPRAAQGRGSLHPQRLPAETIEVPASRAWAPRLISGRAPMCEMTSAAASEPSCADSGSDLPLVKP